MLGLLKAVLTGATMTCTCRDMNARADVQRMTGKCVRGNGEGCGDLADDATHILALTGLELGGLLFALASHRSSVSFS